MAAKRPEWITTAWSEKSSAVRMTGRSSGDYGEFRLGLGPDIDPELKIRLSLRRR
jgi:hypothetical protein